MPSQFRALWTTPGGGAGQSVFHTQDVTGDVDAGAATVLFTGFFNSIVDNLPNEVSVIMSPEVLTLSPTGTLLDVYPVSQGPAVDGLTDLGYNRAAGARIDWNTSVIAGGRRLRGRTYIVPINGSAFDSNGLLVTTTVNRLQNAADDLIDGLAGIGVPLVVWSRTHGVAATVSTAAVPPDGAILRGRRD